MKKTILLSAAMLAFSSLPANAGGISFSFFSPAPIYVAPPSQPVYYVPQYQVVQTYPVAYRYYQPTYVRYNNYYKNGKKNHHKNRTYSREWHDSGDYYRRYYTHSE